MRSDVRIPKTMARAGYRQHTDREEVRQQPGDLGLDVFDLPLVEYDGVALLTTVPNQDLVVVTDALDVVAAGSEVGEIGRQPRDVTTPAYIGGEFFLLRYHPAGPARFHKLLHGLLHPRLELERPDHLEREKGRNRE